MLKSALTIIKTEPALITLNGAIVAITALVLRQHVTPVATLNAQAHAL
jgi:hypothetical protein